MGKSKMERRNPLIIDKSEPVALATAPSGPPGVSQLEFGQIRTDGGTQMRAGLNEETVAEYLELIQDRKEWPFPPVVTFYDGETYWLGDGFHRVEAVRRYVQREQVVYAVTAEVRSGTRRDAVLCAAGSNAAHGLRRTSADKRRAVETLLRDPEWGQWSNREIARRCHVDEKLVRTLRESLSAAKPQIENSELSGEFPQIEGKSLSAVKPQIAIGSVSGEIPQIENSELSGGFRQIERIVRRGETVYTMDVSGQRAPRKRIPKGYAGPASGGPQGAPLTLDETIALVWGAIRDLVQSGAPGDQLAWINTLPDDYGFYRDTPADRTMDAETLQAAKRHVITELQSQLARRPDSRRRRALLSDDSDLAQPGSGGREQANGAVEHNEDGAGPWLSAVLSGRPRLPRSVRVQKLLSLYQEVLATLDEYSRLVDSVNAGYAADAQQMLTGMIAALEREVEPTAES
jgi:hypothetical protein